MICENCGNKIVRSGKRLSQNYRHIFANEYGNFITAKTYKNCDKPHPKKIISD